MTIPASAATAAYLNAAKGALQGTAKGAEQETAQKPGGDFEAMLKTAVDQVQQTGARAESLTAAQAVGKADMVDVVTAVAETELTVRTLVTVRDRVISAYQEIMRMPI